MISLSAYSNVPNYQNAIDQAPAPVAASEIVLAECLNTNVRALLDKAAPHGETADLSNFLTQVEGITPTLTPEQKNELRHHIYSSTRTQGCWKICNSDSSSYRSLMKNDEAVANHFHRVLAALGPA